MAMMKISQAIATIQEAMASLPIGSELHRATLKAVNDLSKHFQGPTDATGPAQQTMLQDQQRQLQQRALLQRIMQNSGGRSVNPASTPQPGA
jgi:hypothetical protein